MKTVAFALKGVSPIGFSAPKPSTKEDKETHEAYEVRTWREKLHVDDAGMCFIPPMAIKNAMTSIAQYKSEKIPGKGQSKFTKHFTAGILVPDPLSLGVKAADVKSIKVFVPSDGKRGGGTRVWKHFPVINEWATTGLMVLLDDILEADTDRVERYLSEAGQLVGLGWFRPERNGYYGRFSVTSFKVS